MKIIFISIAVLILSVGGYLAYKWYTGRNTLSTTSTTTAVSNLPKDPVIVIPGPYTQIPTGTTTAKK